MKIEFCLDWVSRSTVKGSSFKSAEYYSLCLEYRKRIAFFTPIEFGGAKRRLKDGHESLWLCHPAGKLVNSEQLAQKLNAEKLAAPSCLIVAVGAADGFSVADCGKADFLWSFGPATFPHELAAVMALEQLYRAHCILSGHPYHSGH